MNSKSRQIGEANFEELKQETKEGSGKRGIEFLLDIPLTITVELGRTKMLVKDLLQLGQGSVIELDKIAGEPMEVLVNNKLVARGEVVVVNEKFGVRVTDIITPVERIKQLK
jgi:flagellar motor switch protein FliN/FliY